MKIGFIGAGNMGGAIFRGFIKNNAFEPKNIHIYRKNMDKLKEDAKNLGITAEDSAVNLVKNVDCVVLAVKPNMFPSVIEEIKEEVKAKGSLIVSIAAGLSTENIKEMFGFDLSIIRIMPNINAEICLSTSACCYNKLVEENQLKAIKEAFGKIGYITEVEESKFAIFTAIAGCSPAYVYLFIDSLAKGAQKLGMSKKQALEIATSAVIGSAKMLEASEGEHPWSLIDKVCSPGGTTIEGVCTLEEYKFESAVVKAVENSVIKDRELSKK